MPVDVLMRQAVVRAQVLPAVVAVEELVAQPEPQLGMPRQVGDRREPEPLRHVAADGQRVVVAEAQRAGS